MKPISSFLLAIAASSLMLGKSDAGTVVNAGDFGAGSLRQAINDAQKGEVITFEARLDGQTIFLGGSELLIDKDLTIDAAALSHGVTLDGEQESRVFLIAEDVSVFLSGLKIVNGRGGWRGGAILHQGLDLRITDSEFVNNVARCGNGGAIADNWRVGRGGNLTIERTAFRNNDADEGCDDDGGQGGAISMSGQGSLNIIDCIFEQNSADYDGGAISLGNTGRNVIRRSSFAANVNGAISGDSESAIQDCAFYDHSGTVIEFSGEDGPPLVIENSTFARNLEAIGNSGALHLRNSTISDNTNGIESDGVALTLENSIVAGNSHSNLDIGQSKVEYLGTNIIDQDPVLAPLGDYGGITLTMPPLAGSPAIDAGVWTEESPSTDQRGFVRLSESPLDVGAVELGPEKFVMNANDSSEGSLREAIEKAAPGDRIVFAEQLTGKRVTLKGEPLRIDKDITIDASFLAGGMTIDGAQESRLFEISENAGALLSGLTLTNGAAIGEEQQGLGGGILCHGNLTLAHTKLENCQAVDGGGIYAEGRLSLTQCEIRNNLASGDGKEVFASGAIAHEGRSLIISGTVIDNNGDAVSTAGQLAMLDCSVINNSTGVRLLASTSPIAIERCTFASNRTGFAFHGDVVTDTTMENCTFHDNQTGLVVDGKLTQRGRIYRFEVQYCTFSGNQTGIMHSDQSRVVNLFMCIVAGNSTANMMPPWPFKSDKFWMTDGEPSLAPLGYYGGPTQTMPPLFGSPVIGTYTDPPIRYQLTDQRGRTRLAKAWDLGAYQTGSPMNYEAWAVETLQSRSDTAFDGDANGDGISNGIEYALGGSDRPRLIHTSNLGTEFYFNYRPETAVDLVWKVTRSNNLREFTEVLRFENGQPVVTPGFTFERDAQAFRLRDPMPLLGGAYYRLEVERKGR
ncbi:MAG: hypothetical protein ACI9DF_004095 [Verrucomicrobiales bacterium]|jgi:hypothetical protein